ncbi:MAG: hypothetical protein SNH01_01070 [Rikenellaceae bacterium]
MWKKEFSDILPLLGHRNWVLVVDKAYPLQSADGIKYINSGQDIDVVLKEVIAMMDEASHVKPTIYTDKELTVLSQIGAKESAMVDTLNSIFEGREVQSLLHDMVFEKLDTASKLFNVVVIKTESTVAYSSVFFELDCGYWSAEKEQKLRNLLK